MQSIWADQRLLTINALSRQWCKIATTDRSRGAGIEDAGSQKLMLAILEKKYKTTLFSFMYAHIFLHAYWPSEV
jgi:hypothetical protein